MIEARALRKAFGVSLVLRDVDLDVGRGEIVAVLGPNGAGKSTLLRLLACISRANAGRLSLFGADCHPGRPTLDVLARIGFLGPALRGSVAAAEPRVLCPPLFQARRRGDADAVTRASLGRSGSGTRWSARRARCRAARGGWRSPRDPAPAGLLLLDRPFTALDEAAATC